MITLLTCFGLVFAVGFGVCNLAAAAALFLAALAVDVTIMAALSDGGRSDHDERGGLGE